MSENCKDFINKCLSKTANNRLGSNGDIQEILSHPWFSDVNPQYLLAKKLDVEFKPSLSANALDTT